jgi:aspartyl-tRNA(Asn)/glutamyl-tRNA(Gln) amidotransferase subunit A
MMRPVRSAREIRDAVASGRASAVEVCRSTLDGIDALNGRLNAFLSVAADRALHAAAAVDRDPGRARLPLAGVPIALKDNLCTRGMPTTAGSRMLDGYVAPYDATVVERLEAAGAVIVGKTNCDEFAMGSSTEHSAFGPTRNPWDLSRAPGGSSGGSAAAVAAGLVPAALGTDTGGSIRQPASFCGITGFKPTYGRVSRYGLLAFASSLDQIGPLTRTVDDAVLLLSVIAGHDPRDSTSSGDGDLDWRSSDGLAGMRVGVPREWLREGTDPQVLAALDVALDQLRGAGASLVDVTLPHASHAIPVYYLVATAEASSNLARYDGVRYGHRATSGTLAEMYERSRGEGFGREVKRRIMLGTYVLSAGYYDAYYRKAQQVRTLIARDYDQAFTLVDVIALPTSPTAAFPLGERTDDPLRMYLADTFTVAANLAGLPAISVPCGFTDDHLPIGLQLVGRAGNDSSVLRAAAGYEALTSWTGARPPIA